MENHAATVQATVIMGTTLSECIVESVGIYCVVLPDRLPESLQRLVRHNAGARV